MSEKICGIYCIENTYNHKKYIGLSRDVYKRLSQHRINLRMGKHSNEHLLSSFLFYGEEFFDFYLIEECSEENLNSREIFYIKYFSSNNRETGYNILSGGGGTAGRIVSDETREKISKINKGRVFSAERNAKVSASKKGIPKNITKEWREKIIKANTGVKVKNSKNKYRGVSYCNRDKTFRVYFKRKAHGSFKDEVVAAKIWDSLCWEFLQDLSKLNFPEDYALKQEK